MSGAGSVGGYAERAGQALVAGCDILVVCNNPDGVDEVLDSLGDYSNPATQMRMIRLHGQQSHARLFDGDDWNGACQELDRFNRRLGLAESGDLFE